MSRRTAAASDAVPRHDTPEAAPGPVASPDRIVALDVLRGFAILGILLVNAPLFLQPLAALTLGGGEMAILDRIAATATAALAEGKFFTLFSLLFGIGVAMQMRRAERKGAAFAPFFVRRMAILLAIGVAHATLLWWGDILVFYALFGLLLIPLRRASARRAARLAVVVACVPILLNVGLFGLTRLAAATPDGRDALSGGVQASIAEAERSSAAALEAYGGSDLGAMIAVRVDEWILSSTGIVLNGMAFLVVAMFLLGLAIGKAGLLADTERHLSTIRRARWAGFAVGVPATVAWLWIRPESVYAFDLDTIASTAAFVVSAPALSIAYAASLVLASREPAGQRRLMPLAAVGRVALSAYLMQSVVMTTLAYGYGAGLFGSVGPAGALAIAVVVLALQVPLAIAWTRRFRFGPVEWLWRTLSYGRLQPFGRPSVARG
jgi:uncharacterized protein